jgi:cobalt-zinc-cadmium efflux system membrane fusion protein
MGRILLSSLLVLLCVSLAVGGAYWFFMVRPASAHTPSAAHESAKPEIVRRVDVNTVVIPGDVATSIGLHVAEVKKATRPRPMAPLPGRLNLDTIAHVHARFPGEIVALGTTQGEETSEARSSPSSSGRPLRPYDHVRKDQLLAVLWSKDLGEKKSEWVDAQSKLTLDRGILKDMQDLYEKGATPERSVRDAQRNVDADIIALRKAEHTLLSWGLKEKEMAELRTEAEKPDRRLKDQKQPYERWARVEIRSPQDGTIMEDNIALRDIISDTTMDLFKISDTSNLVVWANLYEEDLPTIQKLPRPIRWDIKVPSQPGVSYPGTLDVIGGMIDSNQHTAMVKGFVDNSRGDLVVGQYVTANISIPPAANELEIPTGALVEDGHDSIVFVQVKGEKNQFQRRKVKVLRRYQDVVYVRADSDGKDAIHPGDQVITGGAVLLNEAMNDLPVEAPK